MTIERAAVAICGEDYSGSWFYIDAGQQDHYRKQARAALKAIAEPTPEMIAAGTLVIMRRGLIDEGAAKRAWHDMHAAMMREKE